MISNQAKDAKEFSDVMSEELKAARAKIEELTLKLNYLRNRNEVTDKAASNEEIESLAREKYPESGSEYNFYRRQGFIFGAEEFIRRTGAKWEARVRDLDQRILILQAVGHDLEAKLAIAIEALEILKVACNDKMPDLGATNFIARKLSKLKTPDASPIEKDNLK